MTWDIKKIHNLSRPGEEAIAGDLVEIECVGGFVRQVDPVTRKAGEANQRFLVGDGGSITPTRQNVNNYAPSPQAGKHT